MSESSRSDWILLGAVLGFTAGLIGMVFSGSASSYFTTLLCFVPVLVGAAFGAIAGLLAHWLYKLILDRRNTPGAA
ncbi:MAG: hypothetical protein R3335_11630 [Anaerolineales bacterium]|nr:hypothetical protein [Anaerolineales bacterium]